VLLRPTRHKIGHDVSQAHVWKKLNLTQQKQAFTNQKKCTTTQNKHKKIKPGLVNVQPGSGAGLFSKEKIVRQEISKEK